MARVTLLGIPIDPLTMQEALNQLKAFLQSERPHHVMTVNSEMLVESTKNPKFRKVMQQTSLNLPDSHGVVWAAIKTGQQISERVAGVDCVSRLCEELTDDTPVFLLGAGEGISEKAANVLKAKNPHLNIVGAFAGSPSKEAANDIVSRINSARPTFLLVAYGAPKQDLWIHEYLPGLPSVRVAMGVGGTFDFLAGNKKRAPQWMRALGAEWLWRLVLEPRRIGRIVNAVVVFPWLVIRNKQYEA